MKYSTLPIILKNTKILLIKGARVALQRAEVMQRNNIDLDINKIIKTGHIEEFEDISKLVPDIDENLKTMLTKMLDDEINKRAIVFSELVTFIELSLNQEGN